MVNEVKRFLMTLSEGIYVDGTVGTGGHSAAIGKEISDKGRLICIDRDPEALRISRERLGHIACEVTFVRGSFSDLDTIMRDLEIGMVHGVLLDLGMSSYQLDHSNRGFSFNRDEPLDMRMDPDEEMDAGQLVDSLPVSEIERLLRDYGEEKRARLISRSIGRERIKKPIESSLQLATIIRSIIPPPHHPGAKDPATRTFQALRIAVNKELENLEFFLDRLPPLIERGGRLVLIMYHSLEDRIVKQAMTAWERGCICPPDLPRCACGRKPLFKRVFKRGIKPQKSEIEGNPRARSAILRAAERI